MCNIAGYVGEKNAAPILIDMMRKEEGWDAGFYTGIATLHEGKIYYAKVVGDLNYLLKHTNAASLPGSIGIIHSRTNSGGNVEWGHPFIGEKNGQITTAYIANGSQGMFCDRLDEASEIAANLEQAGYTFRSRTAERIGRYPTLPGGGSAHMSDIMAQLVTAKIDAGSTPDEAMNEAFCQMPAEIVGLLLSLSEPDCITWSRINMPMFVGFAPHGAYLSSTPQAFPEDGGDPALLPPSAGGKIFARHYTVSVYSAPPVTPAPITAGLMHQAYAAIENALQEKYCTMPELSKIIQPFFNSATCPPRNAVVYSVLYSLQRENRLLIKSETRPGAENGLTAPLFLAGLKKE